MSWSYLLVLSLVEDVFFFLHNPCYIGHYQIINEDMDLCEKSLIVQSQQKETQTFK